MRYFCRNICFMSAFDNLNLSNPLRNAIDDLGFEKPTPIQEESYPVILSGKDMVGIAQTGTGKTFAYMMPILRDLKFSKQINPRVLVLVPTRELVIQVVAQTDHLTKYMNVRAMGVYGGTNINTQKIAVAEGMDVLVATPGRLYDLVLSRSIELKSIKKLVIDEVDVMLDLGFRFQLTNIFELLPEKRQNVMFSATMTEDVDLLIDDFFTAPTKISIAVSGTPLDNIDQEAYLTENFYTKVNLLSYLIADRETFEKVLVFVANKRSADRLYEALETLYERELNVMHSNKSQNFRIRSLEEFNSGEKRILVATDVIARGLDLEKISHVFNFDVPIFPENYMHRIGRTGRAERAGKTILFYTEKEREAKEAIELLMAYEIPEVSFPEAVEVSYELTPEERPKDKELNSPHKLTNVATPGPAFHEKSEKNKKTNQGGSYLRKKKKYKKPIRRGDKGLNTKKK